MFIKNVLFITYEKYETEANVRMCRNEKLQRHGLERKHNRSN